jgi:hypothetical protein
MSAAAAEQLRSILISTLLALPRQRLASEAAKSEVGDVGHLRTVGGPEEGPIFGGEAH